MLMTIAAAATVSVALLFYHIYFSVFSGPLARIPGPKSFALTKLRLIYDEYKGTRTRKLNALHQEYGPVVRVGPNEVAFNSVSALRTIYGAGSGFERTKFYHIFAVYGRENMFSFSSTKQHGQRKKIFASAYAKSAMLKGETADMIQAKVRKYLELLEREGRKSDIFSSLHYFSLDNITEFLYGDFGKTSCLDGADRALLSDVMESSAASRKLTWFNINLPKFTAWLYSRTGIMGYIARQFYPMQTPSPYTGIRDHAMEAYRAFSNASPSERAQQQASLISILWKHHYTQKEGGLDDLDIASECADQLDGGTDTTSDTLMFAIWALSRPEHKKFQQRLIDEVRGLSADDLDNGIPQTRAADKLAYVDAVVKETLRLYSPLPASEPRSQDKAITIDGYVIPPRVVVSMSPYALHRNPAVFKEPLQFNPDRWLDHSQDLAEMKRLFWAFSSGGRMCIGMHLAMAEMTTLLATIYREYTTEPKGPFGTVSPAITSRYEVFYDEGCSGMREHECWIEFKPQSV